MVSHSMAAGDASDEKLGRGNIVIAEIAAATKSVLRNTPLSFVWFNWTVTFTPFHFVVVTRFRSRHPG